MARYRDYDDYDERPRRAPRRRRYEADDYVDEYRPRRAPPARRRMRYEREARAGRATYARQPPSRRATHSRRTRARDERHGMSPTVVVGLLANILLLATIAVLYFVFPATWQRLIHIRDAGPPQLATGADVIVLAHAVPWGTLSLADGLPAPSATASPAASPSAQATAQPTAAPSPSAPASVTPTTTPTPAALKPAGTAGIWSYYQLARGTHTIVYSAAPFPTMRCQISIPAASGDTCTLLPGLATSDVRALGAARIVDAQATADHLAPDAQKALFDAIQAAASPQPTSVQYGERYLNGSGQVTFNYVTLQAALLYTVNTDPAHALPLPSGAPSATPTASPSTSASQTPAASGTPSTTPGTTPGTTPSPATACVSLCDPPAAPDDASSSAASTTGDTSASAQTTPTATNAPQPWSQLANFAPSWRYTNSRGTETAGEVSTQGGNASAVVAITWNGTWQVSVSDADKARLLGGIVANAASALKPPTDWTVKTYPATNPADGYLVIAGPSNGTSAQMAQLLYRFGVLLSVNSVAYSTFPSVPHATFAERTIAGGIKTS